MAERIYRALAEIGGATVQRFAARIKGRVIMPGDGQYESARLVWNRMIDKRPGMIVECSEVGERHTRGQLCARQRPPDGNSGRPSQPWREIGMRRRDCNQRRTDEKNYN